MVACEDTRTSGKLFAHYGIETPRLSFHIHNEHGRVTQLVERMQAGETVALISDAGTPGISDPGFLLVRAAAEAGVRVEALPGATAFVPALVASGLPTDRFVFEGFLPHKKGRQTRLKALADEPRTIVLYESPHRLVKLLGQLAEHLGEDRPAAVGARADQAARGGPPGDGDRVGGPLRRPGQGARRDRGRGRRGVTPGHPASGHRSPTRHRLPSGSARRISRAHGWSSTATPNSAAMGSTAST